MYLYQIFASGRREIRTFLSLFSRLPDGCLGYETDSGHFAGASLGSYPATISRTTRVLRHVLANDLCYITLLINERGAKSLLTSFRQTWCEAPVEGFYTRNRVAPYEMRSSEVRGKCIFIKYLRLEDAIFSLRYRTLT